MSVATTMRDHLHHTCNHFRRAEHYCRAPANKRRCLRLLCGSYTRRGVLRPLEYGRPTSVPSAQKPQPANSHGAAVQGDEPSRLCGRVSQRCGRPDLCDGFEKETLTAYGWRNKLEQPLRTLGGRRLSEAPRSVGGSETLGRGDGNILRGPVPVHLFDALLAAGGTLESANDRVALTRFSYQSRNER